MNGQQQAEAPDTELGDGADHDTMTHGPTVGPFAKWD